MMTQHIPQHNAQIRHTPGADTMVLFLHGIMGSPAQFSFLLESAALVGCAYAAPLLPGHGAGPLSFAQSNVALWKAFAVEQARQAALQYRRVLLVGHSMGGLLALHVLRARPAGVGGAFCLGLPLYMHPSLRTARLSLHVLLRQGQARDTFLQAALENTSVNLRTVSPAWLKNFLGLLRFASETRAALPALQPEGPFLFSAGDEIVSLRSLRFLQKHAPHAKAGVLPHSSHYVYAADDRADILRQFEAFLRA